VRLDTLAVSRRLPSPAWYPDRMATAHHALRIRPRRPPGAVPPWHGCAQIKHSALHEHRGSAQLQIGVGRELVAIEARDIGDQLPRTIDSIGRLLPKAADLDKLGWGRRYKARIVPPICTGEVVGLTELRAQHPWDSGRREHFSIAI
jgi:hypothetical protein